MRSTPSASTRGSNSSVTATRAGYTTPEGALNLVSLATSHGIRVGGAHNALTDALITAQVFQRILRQLERWGVPTVAELLKIGSPHRRIETHDGAMPLS